MNVQKLLKFKVLKYAPLLFVVYLFFVGVDSLCPPSPELSETLVNKSNPRNFIIFFDGTSNYPAHNTNIYKLYKLAKKNQGANTSSFYIEGVGARGKILGNALGWGTAYRVRKAYSFLIQNFSKNKGNKVYIFGFSRGAYQARILASLLHTAGIPTYQEEINKTEANSDYLASKVYKAFKQKEATLEERRLSVAKEFNTKPYDPKNPDKNHYLAPVTVSFLGLWDTVEALGIPDYDENIENPNSRYNDQLCNVEKAAHAVSLDDNRAQIFTPILLTRQHLTDDCPTQKIDEHGNEVLFSIDEHVNEVWFSGAHADVGGTIESTDQGFFKYNYNKIMGYKPHISENGIGNNSLLWMLDQVAENSHEIFPKENCIKANPYAPSNDPKKQAVGIIYKNLKRNLWAYSDTKYNKGKLKLHRSVICRLERIPPKAHEFNWHSSPFKTCFRETGDPKRPYLYDQNRASFCPDVTGQADCLQPNKI